MSAYFEYPCPDCRTTTTLHDPECTFDGASPSSIEKAYMDIISVLSAEPQAERTLQEAAHEWSRLHRGALSTLRREHRVEETEEGVLYLLTPEERKERVAEPTNEPLRTVYRHGSVPGCHDNAVFALIAFYEMVGFSWEETREHVIAWLEESGSWDRGGFEEDTLEELVDSKRHVYEEGYGWKQAATEAKAVIDRRR